MNRQRTYLFLLIFLIGGQAAPAQTDSTRATPNPNPVTIKMIRATVEFLATDKKFGRKPRVPCQPCQSYEDLTRYVTQNKLMGADQVIIDARRQAQKALTANPATMPAALRTFLLERTTGGPRSYRAKLPSFAGYQRTLDAAVGGTATSESPTDSVVTDDTDTTAITDDTVVTNETVAPKTSATPELMPHLSLIALILSLISLIGVITLFLQRSRTPTEPVKHNPLAPLTNLEAEINRMKAENRKLSDRLTTLEKGDKQPSNTVRPDQRPQNQSQPRPAQPTVPVPPASVAEAMPPVPTLPPAYNSPAPVANTIRSVPTMQYGRTADLGDGFSVGGLVAAPDRDTVFEIHRQSDTAALYQVSDQPELQRLALSDPYSYLNETCSYLTQPRPGSRIRTEKPGQLSLQGDKWAIVEKAQISFIA